MNATATATAKTIHLNRVLPGYYCYNARDYAASYDILKQAPGVWTVKTRITQTGVEEAWIVTSLSAARAFIASHKAENNIA